MQSQTRTQQRNAFWEEHVQAYRASALSKAQYCRDNNVIYHQFIYWASKLAEVPELDNTEPAPSSSKLIPIMLSQSDHNTGLQLHLPNGVLIKGIDERSVEMVGRLIKQL